MWRRAATLTTRVALLASCALCAAGHIGETPLSLAQRLSAAHQETCTCADEPEPTTAQVLQLVVAPGVELAVWVAGSADTSVPHFLLLHGSFDGGYPTMLATATRILARHGGEARVIAPNQRGMEGSYSPNEDSAYAFWSLVDDAKAVVDALVPPKGKVHVVSNRGFGGMISCGLAFRYPGAVASQTLSNSPHPAHFGDLIDRSARQRERSRFIRMFIDPDFDPSSSSDPQRSADFDSLGLASLRYYNANCRRAAPDHLDYSCHLGGVLDPVGVVATPTHFLWATQDETFDSDSVLAGTPAYFSDLRHLERVEFEGSNGPMPSGLALTDPCFVAARASDLAWEVDHPGASSIAAPWGNGDPPPSGGTLRKFELSNDAAVCGDGSRAAYYVRETSGSDDVIVLFEGSGDGGCTSAEGCAEWLVNRTAFAGQSGAAAAAFPDTLPATGLMSASSCENPAFAAYTAVYVPYCTGDFWSADVEASEGTGGMHLRGQRVFQEVLREVSGSFFAPETRLVLAGAEAGAVGVLQHLPWVNGTFAGVVDRIAAIADSAWAGGVGAAGDASAVELARVYGLTPSAPCATPWGESGLPCCLSPACMAARHATPPAGTPLLNLVPLGERPRATRRTLRGYASAKDTTLGEVRSTHAGYWAASDVTTYAIDDGEEIGGYSARVLTALRESLVSDQESSAVSAWASTNPRSAMKRARVDLLSAPSMLDVLESWKARFESTELARSGGRLYAPAAAVTGSCESAVFCGGYPTVLQPRFASDGTVMPTSGASQKFGVERFTEEFTSAVQIYTAAQLAQVAAGDTASAMRNASMDRILQQVQNVVRGINENDQSCLYSTDRQLMMLRGIMQSEADFDKRASFFEDDIVMNIPGVGVYHGPASVVEYVRVQDYRYNDLNHVQLQSFQTFSLSKESVDALHLQEDSVAAWENYTRISAPVFYHSFGFTPCSGRLAEWNLTFSVESGIDYFVSSAYSHPRLCAKVQKYCTGENRQFESLGQCVDFYESLPRVDPACLDRDNGVGYALQGNTSLCRFLHHFMAQFSPETHCYHVGPGGADANGKIKCSSVDCGPSGGGAPTSNSPASLPGPAAVECTDEIQADTEIRFLAILPYCVDSLTKQRCDARCAQALKQFGLAGHGERSRQRSAATCACWQRTLEAPLSSLLPVLGIDPLAYTLLCPEVLPDAGHCRAQPRACPTAQFFSTRTWRCEDVMETVHEAPVRAIHAASALWGVRDPSPVQRAVSYVDLDVFEELACHSKGKWCYTAGGGFGLKEAYAPDGITRPFIGGPWVRSYSTVVGAIKQPGQRRGPTAAFNKINLATPDVISPSNPILQSTGTPAHTKARAMVFAAYPAFRDPEVVLGEIPDLLAQHFERGGTYQDMDSALLSELVSYVVSSVFDVLYPGHTGITQELSIAVSSYLALAKYNSHSREFLESAGHFPDDGMREARKVMATWIQAYFGGIRMVELAEIAGIAVDEAGMVLADATVVALTGVFSTSTAVAERLTSDLCTHAPLFGAQPARYIIEHLRLTPSVRWFRFHPEEGATDIVATGLESGRRRTYANGDTFYALADLGAANRDPSVFQDPNVFDPKRGDLMNVLSFNAIEGEIQAGEGPSILRSCPGHDLALVMVQALVEKLLPTDETFDAICHVIYREALLDAQVVIVIVVCFFSAFSMIAVKIVAVVERRRLRDECETAIQRKNEATTHHSDTSHGESYAFNPRREAEKIHSQHAAAMAMKFFTSDEEKAEEKRKQRKLGGKKTLRNGLSLRLNRADSGESRSVRDMLATTPNPLFRAAGSGSNTPKGRNRRMTVTVRKNLEKAPRPTFAAAVLGKKGHAALKLNGVTATVSKGGNRGKRLLDDVHVSFAPGKLTAIMGASGAGKSTLLSVASMRSSRNLRLSGDMRCNGHSIETPQEVDDFARSVGFVPQQLDLTIDLELTAAENLYYQVRMRWDNDTAASIREVYEHTNTSEAVGDLVIEVLVKLDLLEHANTAVADLSGGQKRRLAIAVECIKPSPIIFLDEPTTGQDAVTALDIVQLLRRLAGGLGDLHPKTVVMVIHQPREEIFALVDSVILVAKGRCVYNGPPLDALRALADAGAAVDEEALPAMASSRAGMERPIAHTSHNLADKIMDAVASLDAEGVERAALASARGFRADSGAGMGRRGSIGVGAKHGAAIASLYHRVAALVLRRAWKDTPLNMTLVFLVYPLSIYFAGGLPNAASGGDPKAQELVSQILLTCLQPTTILLGSCLYDMVAFGRSFRWMQRSRVVQGGEAAIDVTLFTTSIVVLSFLPVLILCVLTGWSAYWTPELVTRVVAFAFAGAVFPVLLQYTLVAHGVNEMDSMDNSQIAGTGVQFSVLCYVGLGVAFGGLMYRPTEVPEFFSALSYISAGFYTQTGMVTVALHDVVLSDGVPGNVVLYQMGLTQMKMIPTFALLFLNVGSVILVAALAVVFMRPFHHPITVHREHLHRSSLAGVQMVELASRLKAAFGRGMLPSRKELQEEDAQPSPVDDSVVVVSDEQLSVAAPPASLCAEEEEEEANRIENGAPM